MTLANYEVYIYVNYLCYIHNHIFINFIVMLEGYTGKTALSTRKKIIQILII